MCFDKENDVKPVGEIYYKVFRVMEGKLYNLAYTLSGKSILSRVGVYTEMMRYYNEDCEIKDTLPDSTSFGYNVWEKEEEAQIFMERISKMFTADLVIRKVKCSNHIQSGKKYVKLIGQGDKGMGQVFTFKNIELI